MSYFASMLMTPVKAQELPKGRKVIGIKARARDPNAWKPSDDLCDKYRSALASGDATARVLAERIGISRDRVDRHIAILLDARKIARNQDKVNVPGASRPSHTYRWVGD